MHFNRVFKVRFFFKSSRVNFILIHTEYLSIQISAFKIKIKDCEGKEYFQF